MLYSLLCIKRHSPLLADTHFCSAFVDWIKIRQEEFLVISSFAKYLANLIISLQDHISSSVNRNIGIVHCTDFTVLVYKLRVLIISGPSSNKDCKVILILLHL